MKKQTTLATPTLPLPKGETIALAPVKPVKAGKAGKVESKLAKVKPAKVKEAKKAKVPAGISCGSGTAPGVSLFSGKSACAIRSHHGAQVFLAPAPGLKPLPVGHFVAACYGFALCAAKGAYVPQNTPTNADPRKLGVGFKTGTYGTATLVQLGESFKAGSDGVNKGLASYVAMLDGAKWKTRELPRAYAQTKADDNVLDAARVKGGIRLAKAE